MAFHSDIPNFYCKVRKEYLHNLEAHHGDFEKCLVFGVDSVKGVALGFEILTDCGAMFTRVPIVALIHKEDAPTQPLDYLQLWSNFTNSIEVHEWSALKRLTCSVILKDGRWYNGRYMFTVSWIPENHSEPSGTGGYDRAHMIMLDDGRFTLQPNNRIKWYEPSFINKSFPDMPDYKTNEHIWDVETGDKWAFESYADGIEKKVSLDIPGLPIVTSHADLEEIIEAGKRAADSTELLSNRKANG